MEVSFKKDHYSILIVDDDEKDVHQVKEYFEQRNYQIQHVKTEKEAIENFNNKQFDIVICEYIFLDMEGGKLYTTLKNIDVYIPIIVFSHFSDVQHKVAAFKNGCDDYVAKTSELEELEIRMTALLRRIYPPHFCYLVRFKDMELDMVRRKVKKEGKEIDLTEKEYKLLAYLVKNKNKLVTREMILNEVWEKNEETLTNIIDVYINYLRKKIDLPNKESLIKTLRGVGYRMDD